MADVAVVDGAAPSVPVSNGQAHERTVYEATRGRKLAFCMVFILLLPFYLSLAPMLFWRLSQGVWTGTFGLLVLAAGFSAIMFLLLIEVMHSLRTRIELGPKSVKMTLPAGRGPTPIVQYRNFDIPYDDIEAVETRREIYGGSVAPVLLQGARIILKDQSALRLGYINEANTDPCFPYPVIAEQIAHRAGLEVRNRGNVRRSVQKKFLGLNRDFISESEGEVPETEIAALNATHRRWVMRTIALLLGMVVVGIVLDIVFPPSSGLPPALTSVTKAIMGGG